MKALDYLDMPDCVYTQHYVEMDKKEREYYERLRRDLIHPASAGHGLNIQQGGHILMWFGLTWSLELYQQTNARLWRQGQRETVTIHHIICKDTVDEDVMAALEQKDITQEKLISAVKARLY